MFNLFQKKSKLLIYNENQKEDFVEKLESNNISYKLRLRENEFQADKIIYEFTLTESELKKVS